MRPYRKDTSMELEEIVSELEKLPEKPRRHASFYDAIYEIARKQNISIEKLGLKLGRGARYIGGAKSRGSLPKVDNAAMIADACGYTLCLVPSGNVPEDAIVIDWKR